MPRVKMASNSYEAIEGADAIALVTEWDAFRALDLERVKSLAKAPVMVDLRTVYPPQDLIDAGFSYTGIGQG
jgi:UDPglucose 6-dehydrogenase